MRHPAQAETGGITEFVPLPFVHFQAPVYLKGASLPPCMPDADAAAVAAAHAVTAADIAALHSFGNWQLSGKPGAQPLGWWVSAMVMDVYCRPSTTGPNPF